MRSPFIMEDKYARFGAGFVSALTSVSMLIGAPRRRGVAVADMASELDRQ